MKKLMIEISPFIIGFGLAKLGIPLIWLFATVGVFCFVIVPIMAIKAIFSTEN